MVAMAMSLRAMTPGDVEAGLRLCRLSHWNQVARDWDRFVPAGTATVAVDDAGTVIGSVATMRYDAAGARPGGPTLAWLAMVLVDPAARGQGVGGALLARGLDAVADAATVGLDATPLGQPLYEKLGFRPDATLTRMAREPDAPAAPDSPADHSAATIGVCPATLSDLDAIGALDARATGLDRRVMLTWLLEGAANLAWVASSGPDIQGMLLGRRGHRFTHLGPLVADSLDIAGHLLRACVTAHASQPLILDIADAQPHWRATVESLGFTAQRPFARMYKGDWRPLADPTRSFASIGPEFG